jgi:hypothetical protein
MFHLKEYMKDLEKEQMKNTEITKINPSNETSYKNNI